MGTSVFLEVQITDDNQLKTTLLSSALLYMTVYCGAPSIHVEFVKKENCTSEQFCVNLSQKVLDHVHHSFLRDEDVPNVVQKCRLPATYDETNALVRSGLCASVRHMAKVADAECPSKNLSELLGFRNGSLRMCSEVSGWTKLCEIELPSSLTALFSVLRSVDFDTVRHTLEVPADLIRLEAHLEKLPCIHNDDKQKRSALHQWRQLAAAPSTVKDILKQSSRTSSGLLLWLEEPLSHSIRRFELEVSFTELTVEGDKMQCEWLLETEYTTTFTNQNGYKCSASIGKSRPKLSSPNFKNNSPLSSDHCSQNKNQRNGADISKSDICYRMERIDLCLSGKENKQDLVHGIDIKTLLDQRSYKDVKLVHQYSEGLEMTVADLVLFVYVYHLMAALDFKVDGILKHLPKLAQWLSRLVTLRHIVDTGNLCHFQLSRLSQELSSLSVSIHLERTDNWGRTENSENSVHLLKPAMDTLTENDMELSRRCRSKYRAIKPDVTQVLDKLKAGCISPTVGSHPCGSNVALAWDELPLGVHPQEGGVPSDRAQRKCQQLGNLVTAVTAFARMGDVIVDFCSGGGHLGIIIAYLLPQCKVYLVENKEESLALAKSRIDNLHLKNITTFQCNLEYFHGEFDLGVCLHACGVATDMVLKKCIDNLAAFVICPCCYGGIQKTHLISYPRSNVFQQAGISYKDFLTLGHAADQTEFNIALEDQGRYCMNLVDTDRAESAKENNYSVTLCSLQPLTCTPKNNLLTGVPSGRGSVLSANQ